MVGGLIGVGFSTWFITNVDKKEYYSLPQDRWMCWISIYYKNMDAPECVVFKRKDIDLGGFGPRRRDDDIPKGKPIQSM